MNVAERSEHLMMSRVEPWQRTVTKWADHYYPITLLRVMKEGLENPDRFLRYFFAYLTSELRQAGLSLNNVSSDLDGSCHITRSTVLTVVNIMTAIATDLMNSFFLLFKASAGQTPEVARSSEFVDTDHVEGVSRRIRALRDL
ncbi:hypothetical protein V1514DRAFT_230146 [Lipomyces japonicus]|uniref:uncharacterized protein n=1 Tax=Lipomyces japonicus TaxID=56871 RepID=UPI0034CD7299